MQTTSGFKDLSQKYGALANPYRLAILRFVAAEGRATWGQVERELESVFGRRVNPNSLSFHLRKLIDSQFLVQAGTEYRLGRQGTRRKAELLSISRK